MPIPLRVSEGGTVMLNSSDEPTEPPCFLLARFVNLFCFSIFAVSLSKHWGSSGARISVMHLLSLWRQEGGHILKVWSPLNITVLVHFQLGSIMWIFVVLLLWEKQWSKLCLWCVHIEMSMTWYHFQAVSILENSSFFFSHTFCLIYEYFFKKFLPENS